MISLFSKNNLFKIFFFILLSILSIKGSYALENNKDKAYEAKVIEIIEEKEIEIMGSIQLYQKLEIVFEDDNKKNEKIVIENGNQPMSNIVKYNVNDKVLVSSFLDLEGKEIFFITDFIRRDGLIPLLVIFVVLTILVAKWKGFSSIISMVFTFFILFYFVLPKISSGENPVLIVSLASLFIIPISFYLSHGLNKKTTVAIIGSLISLIITGILAFVFINLTHLTGFSSEEAGMLSINKMGMFNMKGLLLAGIMVGVLGVLDDITVSQSAIVSELSKTINSNKKNNLYMRAMNIGKDHIASMVNTLILVYVGASLPLLLIFIDNPHPFSEIVNYEIIAEEITRMLIGSIGLILAVPITTAIAVYFYKKNKEK